MNNRLKTTISVFVIFVVVVFAVGCSNDGLMEQERCGGNKGQYVGSTVGNTTGALKVKTITVKGEPGENQDAYSHGEPDPGHVWKSMDECLHAAADAHSRSYEFERRLAYTFANTVCKKHVAPSTTKFDDYDPCKTSPEVVKIGKPTGCAYINPVPPQTACANPYDLSVEYEPFTTEDGKKLYPSIAFNFQKDTPEKSIFKSIYLSDRPVFGGWIEVFMKGEEIPPGPYWAMSQCCYICEPAK